MAFAQALRSVQAEANRAEACSKRKVRVSRLVAVFVAESPIPTVQELAARLSVHPATVYRDLESPEFLEALDLAIAAELTRAVQEGLRVHLDVMRDPAASAAERMSAARWLWGRWQDMRRALAKAKGTEPVQVIETEEELLAEVVAQIEARARPPAPGLQQDE